MSDNVQENTKENIEKQNTDKADAEIEQKDENTVFDDIFVTESSLFEVEVRYYKNNGNISVEYIDDNFDPEHKGIVTLKVKFKYPSFGDMRAIRELSGTIIGGEKIESDNVRKLEDIRLQVLIREWNVKRPLQIDTLNSKIVKALRYQVTEKIGIEGLI